MKASIEEKELARQIADAKATGDVEVSKQLTQQLIALQSALPHRQASDEELEHAGVNMEKLQKERELQLAIEVAKKAGDYDTVKELTYELIEIQGGQPQHVGARIG